MAKELFFSLPRNYGKANLCRIITESLKKSFPELPPDQDARDKITEALHTLMITSIDGMLQEAPDIKISPDTQHRFKVQIVAKNEHDAELIKKAQARRDAAFKED